MAGVHEGVAHVYEYISGLWIETTQLWANDGASGNTFSKDVRVCGQRIYAGSSNLSQGGNSQEGAVYRWDKVSGNWTFQEEFTLPPPGRSNAYFGDHLGVSANGLIVGAPFISKAYVYEGGCATDPVYHDGFE